MFEENQRRVRIPLAEIPDHVRNAFIAAEDGRFY
jgi:membrane carboxypeptidase/penicillin-binding protein